MKSKIFICCFAVIFIAGCIKKPPPQQTTKIPALQAQTYKPNNIRLEAIQDTAMSVGAQGGLAWRAFQINRMLTQESDYLNQIFNFNALILKNNVLPPVLQEGDMTLNLASDYALRLSDKIYKIDQPPRFVTAAPNWRNYLWMNDAKPPAPNATLLPKDDEERQIWNKNIKIGWQAGIEQANQIFAINLGRLKRDYAGMVLYRKLLAENMVTPPYVAKVNLGVTGGGNLMRINDQVLRITAIPQLNPNAKTWKAVVRPGEAGGEDQDADQANP